MLIDREALLPASLLIGFCFLTGFEIGSFSETEPPSDQAPNAAAYQKKHSIMGIGPEGWTAIFTGALTFSTIGLWLATIGADKTNRISANAAQKAAQTGERSLTDLEGPFIFPVIESNDILAQFKPMRRYDHPTSPDSAVTPEIKFTIKNYGRTPAFPQNVVADFFWGDVADLHGSHLSSEIPDLVIAPGASSEAIERFMQNEIDRAALKSIEDRSNKIILRGYIIYTDVFGYRYQQKFCLHWVPTANIFKAWPRELNERERIHGSGYGPKKR